MQMSMVAAVGCGTMHTGLEVWLGGATLCLAPNAVLPDDLIPNCRPAWRPWLSAPEASGLPAPLLGLNCVGGTAANAVARILK